MKEPDDVGKHLPLTESTFYILSALSEPLHGYRIMQKVAEESRGTVEIGPGTLYGALASLEKSRLICMVRAEGRRKVYALTALGRKVLSEQTRRLDIMVRAGQSASRRA